MARIKLNANNILLYLVALGMLGWLIAMAGVGATQSSCTARFGIWTCGRYLQFGWWGVWYSFFLLVAIAYMTYKRNLTSHSSTIMALITSCLVVTMVGINTFTTGIMIEGYRSQSDAAACGFVFLSMTFMAMIIIIGSFMHLDGTASSAAPKQGASEPQEATETADVECPMPVKATKEGSARDTSMRDT